MNILVIGSGGREHALIDAIKRSKLVEKVFVTPGNGGINQIALNIAVSESDHAGIIEFCRNNTVALVVVGPEAPLVAGIADELRAAGIKVFGSSKLAARMEGSKEFMKQIVTKYGVPTAKYASFTDKDQAIEYVRKQGAPIVVKTDGLAAGKGVTVAMNEEEALEAVEEAFAGKFGDAGRKLVIEEYLEGEEVSFFAVCDGKNAIYSGSAQDHKRVGDGDTGPNTGGMGTYSPTKLVTSELEKQVMDQIIQPTMDGMAAEGCPFVGVLFAGLMITKDGAKLLEYNIRYGDPECQVLMPRLRTDIVEIMLAAASGDLSGKHMEFSDKSAVCVVMAAKGYPGDYSKGSEIQGIADAEKISGVKVYHAGTKYSDGKYLANGGRVLNVVAVADDFKQAREAAYKSVEKINWPEGFCRKDIGWRAMEK